MFCSNCGTWLNDGVKFCHNCGASQYPKNEITRIHEQSAVTNVVEAKCTNCGSALTVDSNLKTAVCPYCKHTYIVDQAINNYNISVTGTVKIENATVNVQGQDIGVLLLRGKEYEDQKKYKTALEYYNKVLDIDTDNDEARSSVERVNTALQNHICFQSAAAASTVLPGGIWPTEGTLFLTRKGLGFATKSKLKAAYNVKAIYDLRKKKIYNYWHIVFKYPGKSGEQKYVPYDVSVDVWIDVIRNAQMGKYPDD